MRAYLLPHCPQQPLPTTTSAFSQASPGLSCHKENGSHQTQLPVLRLIDLPSPTATLLVSGTGVTYCRVPFLQPWAPANSRLHVFLASAPLHVGELQLRILRYWHLLVFLPKISCSSPIPFLGQFLGEDFSEPPVCRIPVPVSVGSPHPG